MREVWIRTQRAAAASRRATNLAIHLLQLRGELIAPIEKNYIVVYKSSLRHWEQVPNLCIAPSQAT
jgi:hypothetical protein